MAATYEVQNVTEDQIPDPSGSGDLIDVFDITYTIPNRSGQFTIQIPQSGDPVTAAYDGITAAVAEVNAIYAGSSGG
jgi:hypothetical protein